MKKGINKEKRKEKITQNKLAKIYETKHNEKKKTISHKHFFLVVYFFDFVPHAS